MSTSDTDDPDRRHAVVLDFFPNGRSGDNRPQYQKQPLGYALGERDFRLYEVTFDDPANVGIGDRIVVDPASERDPERVRRIDHDDLSGGASSELDYAVEELVRREEQRFVDFYNEAQPITLRLHQLNLLPGIGEKLRDSILDQRKRRPFESFEDLESRVTGLHDPVEVLVDRILEELREEDLKYRLFVGREQRQE